MGFVPVLLLAAAALGGGYYLTHRGSDKLPPDLQTTFNDLLAHGQNPQAMRTVADKLDSLGFHQEAAQLRTKASLLDGGPATSPASPATPSGGIPGGSTNPNAPRVDPLPSTPAPAGPALPAQFMKVTTNDPAPSGDLALRDSPSDSANVIGAAEKDSTVTVKNVSADGRFVQVEALNPAGRRASATGWGHAAFLVPTNPMGTSGRFDPMSHAPYSGLPYGATIGGRHALVGGRHALVGALGQMMCLKSCDVRALPTLASGIRGRLESGARCLVKNSVQGFSLVNCEGLQGWVPSSCLCPPGQEAA